MHYRQTLAGELPIEGTGLHSGRAVRMRLVPSPPGSGVVFVRTDAGRIEIPALLDHVRPPSYATVLERDGVTVGTVEHLMAALAALRIDDLRVELDGPEVPILDGSARPFVDLIARTGCSVSDAPRQYLTVVRPVVVTREEKRIAVYPCREFRMTYAIDFDHPQLGYQELSASIWSENAFADKLAPARTFTFEKEVEALRRNGLALGGSLDNAVVVGETRILNGAALRFPDEFVRHKMLDLTGDLALVGHPIRGHVVAYRAGHEMHSRLAERIVRCRDCWYLAPWHESVAGSEAAARA